MTIRTTRPYVCAFCMGTFWTWKYHQKFCNRSCRTKFTWMVNRDEMTANIKESMKAQMGREPWNKGLPWSDEAKATMSKNVTAERRAHFKTIRGGNGKGLTKHEQLLVKTLRPGWRHNFAISLGGRIPGYPTNYKVDFAWPEHRVALEVDGSSHNATGRREQDRKKDEMLALRGWSVLRISNAEAARLSLIFQ